MTPHTQANALSEDAETVRLRDGGRLRLRTVLACDKACFQRAFDRLSSLSRYRRFLASKRRLTEADLRFFTEVDGENHYALVAVEQDPQGHEGEVVGVARYIRLDRPPDAAEIAVTVIDSHQRRGIGRMLLERLLEAAYQRDIRRVRVHLLAENLPVRKLIEELFGDRELKQDGGVISGELPLEAPLADRCGEAREPLFRLLRLAAEAVVLPINLALISSRSRLSALKNKFS